MLDLQGTNHDARTWTASDGFRPERYRNWNESRFNFISQGGGNYDTDHRCAGERLTIALLAVEFLACRLSCAGAG